MVQIKKTKWLEIKKIRSNTEHNCQGCRRIIPIGQHRYNYRFTWLGWQYNRCLQCYQKTMLNTSIDCAKALEECCVQ